MSFAPYASPLRPFPPTTPRSSGCATRRARSLVSTLVRTIIVLLFSGKLIDKKNPQLILNSLPFGLLPEDARASACGSSTSARASSSPQLRREAEKFPGPGAVRRLRQPIGNAGSYYLAADLARAAVAPCMGETWGLVVNEALTAGCGAIVMTNCGRLLSTIFNNRASMSASFPTTRPTPAHRRSSSLSKIEAQHSTGARQLQRAPTAIENGGAGDRRRSIDLAAAPKAKS